MDDALILNEELLQLRVMRLIMIMVVIFVDGGLH